MAHRVGDVGPAFREVVSDVAFQADIPRIMPQDVFQVFVISVNAAVKNSDYHFAACVRIRGPQAARVGGNDIIGPASETAYAGSVCVPCRRGIQLVAVFVQRVVQAVIVAGIIAQRGFQVIRLRADDVFVPGKQTDQFFCAISAAGDQGRFQTAVDYQRIDQGVILSEAGSEDLVHAVRFCDGFRPERYDDLMLRTAGFR